MAMVKLVKATQENWEEAYEVFFRSLQKLISEGKSHYFGGMTQDGTKRSIQKGNYLYLVYRKGDQIPVAAISILKEENYQKYEKLLNGIPEENVATLNAMAVRPELWGQGYARQALRLCIDELRNQGFTTLVGTAHPNNAVCFRTLNYVSDGKGISKTETYTWKTPKGRVLERVRFMFHI